METFRVVRAVAFALILVPLAACGGGGGGTGPGALLAAVQNRDVDPEGRSVDFSFDRRLRPLGPADLSAFAASGGQQALSAAYVGTSEKVVRIVFDALVLPGETTFDVSGLLASGGRPIAPAVAVPLGSTDATPPSMASAAAIAVANAANDRLSIAFSDDLVPADAVDPSHYFFEQPVGTPIPLGPGSFAYDPASRTVEVVFDGAQAAAANLRFGGGFRLLVSGVRDLGGNPIGAGAEVSGLVGGDGMGPVLLAATQNLLADSSGASVDFAFDEMVDATSAEVPANYAGSAGQLALGAMTLTPGDLVRVQFDTPLVPGTDTLSVQNVFDLAGNQMVAVAGRALGSTDLLAPGIADSAATTVSGYGNDFLTVEFSEPVFPSEAGDLSRYALESPPGTPLPLGGASMAFDSASRTATITLAGSGPLAVNLRTGAAFALSCSGIRDLAGNAMPPGSSFLGLVVGDATPPAALSATQNLAADPLGRIADVLFDEPVSLGTSLGASFVASEGQAFVSASELPGSMVLRLAFDEVCVPGSTLITVTGVEDPAGNAGGSFPLSIGTADSTPPSVLGSSATAFSGAANDEVLVAFGEQVVPSDTETPGAWSLESPTGSPVSLAGASFAYDPASATVTITLPDGVNLQFGASYTISVLAVRDIAGNPMPPASSSGTVVGDSTPPVVLVIDRNEVVDPSSRTLDVLFDEAVDRASAETLTNYSIVSKGTPSVLVAALLLADGRTVRLTAGDAVIPGTHRVKVWDVRDLAGNAMPPTKGVAIAP